MKKTKSNKNGLSIRALTARDAYQYFQIAQEDPDMMRFTKFFVVNSIDEAKKKIVSYTSHNEAVYGLFTKSNRLVAVFDVNDDFNDDGNVDGAVVHYFVGRKYRGNNYAYRGIKKLAVELAHEYIKFKFEVRKTNHASIAVQAKLGSEMDTNYASKDCNLFVYNI